MKQRVTARKKVMLNNNLQNAINMGITKAQGKGYTKTWDINQCIIMEIERIARVGNKDLTNGDQSVVALANDGYEISIAQQG